MSNVSNEASITQTPPPGGVEETLILSTGQRQFVGGAMAYMMVAANERGVCPAMHSLG
jgi:hypothetical protein